MKSIKSFVILLILIIISIILLSISSYYLYIFYTKTDCILEFKNFFVSNKQVLDANEFGDYFGGILNPLIGITAAFITFLAFYIQFLANKQITNQFKVQQFESQFYEMLRLHKENVNEITIEQIELVPNKTSLGALLSWEQNYKQVKGRDTFILFSNELEFAFKTILKSEKDKEIAFDEAYKTFFNGLEENDNFFHVLNSIKQIHKKEYIDRGSKAKPSEKLEGIVVKSKYLLFEGHENKLGHYYRHLYHMVKFVVNYDKKIIDYANKRKYLQLVRAQLSNYEQIMLFYNYVSGYGKQWEENKYFSDYRMIHNIYEKLFFDAEYFNRIKENIRNKNPNYKIIKGNKNDYLFEHDIKK